MRFSCLLLGVPLWVTACDSGTDTPDGAETGETDEGGEPVISYCEPGWPGYLEILPGVVTPDPRGVDGDDQVCQAVTDETVPVTFRVKNPHRVLPALGMLRLTLKERDPDIAEWDCIAAVCEVAADSALEWTFDVPNDRPDLEYLFNFRVDVMADGATENCDDLLGGGSFEPTDGTIEFTLGETECE